MRSRGFRGWSGVGKVESICEGVELACVEDLIRGGGPATPPVTPRFKISADANIQNEAPTSGVDGTVGEGLL